MSLIDSRGSGYKETSLELPGGSREESVPEPFKINLMGRDFLFYKEVSSTNSVAAYWAEAGAPDGTVILAESQYAGKGRLDRQWTSPPGKGILMSMILRPRINTHHISQVMLLGGIVTAEAIRKVTALEAGIKWPNDVVINGRKVCGILAESKLGREAPVYVIMGIGINVNLNVDDLPDDRRSSSTSLKIELGHSTSKLMLIRRFISLWDKHYKRYLDQGSAYLRERWILDNVTLGSTVMVDKGGEIVNGLAVDIGENGALLVKTDDGKICAFMAGDVTLTGNRNGSKSGCK